MPGRCSLLAGEVGESLSRCNLNRKTCSSQVMSDQRCEDRLLSAGPEQGWFPAGMSEQLREDEAGMEVVRVGGRGAEALTVRGLEPSVVC